MKKHRYNRVVVGGISALLLAMLCACSQPGTQLDATIPQIADAQSVGSSACLDCHEELGQAFEHNIHNLLADFEYLANSMDNQGCESCHGPASQHIDEGDTEKILSFGSLNAAQASAICQNCHTEGETMEWNHSTHAAYGIGCTDCHTVHDDGANKAMLSKPEDELCYSCHQDVRAKMHMPNHHPVKEGKMGCSDCHNPHGSQTRPMLRTDERKNELCLTCHMDQSGPFAFEHAPVMEDCTICHNPHGTVADNLIKQSEPFLCLQCHELHFHTNFRPNTDALAEYAQYASDSDPAKAAIGTSAQGILNKITGSGIDDKHAMQMAMMTRCSQCHPSVHGSDLPSLYTPGGGSRLTR
ncbi:GSU2203 family decaheme c-type cytochrome [uncultured Desulfuromonas sp.]|uniref:GSU2203 family decaheme c-type cytochrome n=1 Tax=uncultured Desulfuromonas sp. TaxID=181013 RepID=UPI002AAAA6FC|nr:GSU2203 family decaheme c-type cytochrome [uncultured Desulfuromonas sp.]